MSWHFLGIDLGRGENILKVAAAVILPEVILAVGTEILAATEIASGADFVSAIDAINSTTGLTGTEAAKIVGQSAFTAAATDGNLGDVLQNGLTAATGIQVDNIVTDAFDSALAGDVVRSATVAAIGNKDVGQAVALQLIPAGAGAAVGAITSGSTMDDILFPGETVSIPEYGYDWATAQPDTVGDVIVSPGDLGIDVAIAINESGLTTALDTNALFPDDSGVLYNEAGQAAVIPAELYAAGVYASIGPNGGVEVRGPDNLVLLTELQVAGAATAEQLTMLTEGAIESRAGTTATSAPGPATRPAGLTATAEKTTVSSILDFSKVAESLTKSIANIFTVVKQVENGTYGRAPSPYGSFNPYGTLRPQTPGVPVRNADGSVTVNNGNGTQTTTLANGQKVTIPTSTAGTFGGSVGGISTNTLLLVGAGLAAALLLRRK